MEKLHLAILLGSGIILAIGLVSKKISQIPLSRPLIAFSAGILFSFFIPLITVPGPSETDAVVEEVARLSLAIGLMGTAIMLPTGELIRRRKTLAILLTLGMLGMWLISAALVYLLTGVTVLTALLIGAIVTPTDPILARSISEGELARKNIPTRIRYTLLGESGINDGLAYPFVFLAISLIAHKDLITFWGIQTVLWAVVGGSVFGFAIGYLVGILLRWTQKLQLIEEKYYLAFTVLLTLFSISLAQLLRLDGILSVFFAGTGFKLTRSGEEQENERLVQTTTNLFLTLPIFFVLGFILPWQAWIELGWKAPLLIIGILLLRRLPVILLLKKFLAPAIVSWPEAAFAGWFGPIGVSALFYTELALREMANPVIWQLATLIIASSLLVHGVSASPLTKWMGRYQKGRDR